MPAVCAIPLEGRGPGKGQRVKMSRGGENRVKLCNDRLVWKHVFTRFVSCRAIKIFIFNYDNTRWKNICCSMTSFQSHQCNFFFFFYIRPWHSLEKCLLSMKMGQNSMRRNSLHAQSALPRGHWEGLEEDDWSASGPLLPSPQHEHVYMHLQMPQSGE